MNEDQGAPWIKAKLKTHREITWVFPRAVYWGRPNDSGFRPADEASCLISARPCGSKEEGIAVTSSISRSRTQRD